MSGEAKNEVWLKSNRDFNNKTMAFLAVFEGIKLRINTSQWKLELVQKNPGRLRKEIDTLTKV